MTTNDKLARAEAMNLMREVERLRKALEKSAEHCPQCDGLGAYKHKARFVNCEFCEIARAALNTDRSA